MGTDGYYFKKDGFYGGCYVQALPPTQRVKLITDSNDNELFRNVIKLSNALTDELCVEGLKRVQNTIKNIYINEKEKIVTVIFNDNKKQIVKCCEDDQFDVRIGVALAIAYHLYGSKTFFKREVEKMSKIQVKAN